MQGKVIGVNAQIESDSGGNDGVGFAVPSDTVRSIAKKLICDRQGRARLSRRLAARPRERRAPTEIRPSTPAAKAGLQAGDVITSFAGKKITSADALRRRSTRSSRATPSPSRSCAAASRGR